MRRALLAVALVLAATISHASAPMGWHNARDYGVIGDGIADDTAAIQALVNLVPVRATLYFPTGAYKLTATIDCGSKALTIRGDGKGTPTNVYAGGSAFVGNFAGPLWKIQHPARGVDFLDLGFSNQHAAGVGLWVGGMAIVLERLSISAYRGIWAPQNTFTLAIRSVQLVWVGNTAGSVGIQVAGHAKIEAVDVVGYDHGIRACGLGVVIQSARVEVNRIGLALGLDANGAASNLTGAIVEAVALEANDTGVLVYIGSAATFRGLTIRGSANAPAGMSVYGLQVNSAALCEFAGIIANGQFSGSAVRILTQYGQTRLVSVSGANTLVGNPTYPGAKTWDSPPGDFIYQHTNRP